MAELLKLANGQASRVHLAAVDLIPTAMDACTPCRAGFTISQQPVPSAIARHAARAGFQRRAPDGLFKLATPAADGVDEEACGCCGGGGGDRF